MDQAPPPLQDPNQINQQPPAEQGGGGGKCAAGCGIGCLVAVVLCVILGISGYFWLKGKVEEGVETFTSETQEAIEPPQAEQAQIDDVVARFDAFGVALEAGESSEPLVLTGEELNILIHHHPNFSELAGMASLGIEGDLLRGQVSVDLESLNVPIKFIAEQFEGRYFNGVAGFSLNMSGGRPALYLEELEMNGAVIPQMYIDEISKENLFEDLQDSPEMKEFFDKLSDIKVEDGTLTIVPK